MNRCISKCHNLPHRCEWCPNSEEKIKATKKFDQVYLSIIAVMFTVFLILCIANMNDL